MAAGLRDQLIGAWKLISYEERPVDGSPSFYPMSEKPMGIIMYTPDGFMSAQLMKPDRKPFASGDWFKGTDEEYKQEASTYIAYSGPFHADEEQKTLTHSNRKFSAYRDWKKRLVLGSIRKVPGPKLKTEILQWSCSAYWVLSQLALCSPNFSTRVKPSLV